MNIELLKKVQQHFLEEPQRLDMLYGIRRKDSVPCGTVGCIAGWAAILSGRIKPKERAGWQTWDEYEFPWGETEDIAREELDYRGSTLFHVSDWPSQFRCQYQDATDAQGRAEATAARIQHLIDTGE